MTFRLKRYEVSVQGYGSGFFYAKNKNQARMRAFNALQSSNDAITFKRFLQMVGTITQAATGEKFGRPILVGGKPAFWVEHAGGNSVRFIWPGEDYPLISHEMDVTEIETA